MTSLLVGHTQSVKIKGCPSCVKSNFRKTNSIEKRWNIHSSGSHKISSSHISDIKSRRVIPDVEAFRNGRNGIWKDTVKSRKPRSLASSLILTLSLTSLAAFAHAATLSSIRTDTRRLINETNTVNTHCSETELNSWVNMWQSDIGIFLGLPKKSSRTATTVNIATYTLPSDFSYALELFYDQTLSGGEIKLEETDQSELELLYSREWRQDASTDPFHYYFPGVETSTTEVIAIHPPPNAANAGSNKMRLFYVAIAPTLSDDVDQPTIPDAYHNSAQYFVSAICFFKMGEIAAYDRMTLAYREMRQVYKDQIENRKIKAKERVR